MSNDSAGMANGNHHHEDTTSTKFGIMIIRISYFAPFAFFAANCPSPNALLLCDPCALCGWFSPISRDAFTELGSTRTLVGESFAC
jgi:hypothetical protein